MARHRQRGERRRFEEVPDEVGGKALAVREPSRDVEVVVRVGEARLDHNESGREDADDE